MPPKPSASKAAFLNKKPSMKPSPMKSNNRQQLALVVRPEAAKQTKMKWEIAKNGALGALLAKSSAG